jgi:UPF0271 protein
MIFIDINCDVGEGFENEAELFPYISSCNIACGAHAGSVKIIDKTIALAIEHNVKVGAHPSYPDKEDFGRKVMAISDEKLAESIENQIDLILDRLSKKKQKLHHIKPHGALYNELAKNEKLAIIFVSILKKYDSTYFLYVPYNSVIAEVAIKNNIKIKYEAFLDRNYNDDLSLVSRVHEKALIKDEYEAFSHVLRMVKVEKIRTISGLEKKIKAATFCLHGDSVNAVHLLKKVSNLLKKEQIFVKK